MVVRLATAVPRYRSMLASLTGVLLVGLLAATAHATYAPVHTTGDALVRPGKWNPKKAPPGWEVIEVGNYQVQSHVGRDKGEALAHHLEGMLELYREFLPFNKKMPTFVLKIFRDYREFKEYGGGGAAHYDKRNKEIVCYDTGIILGVRDIPAQIQLADDLDIEFTEIERARLDQLFEQTTEAYTYDLASVLSHEGWHQYFHYYTVSWVSMPSWLDEGLGDYFFTAHQPEPGADHQLGELNHNRLRRIRQAFDEGTSVTFERLLEFEQQDYYSNASVFYAQGWSMVYFLMQHPEKKKRQLIPRLIKDFKRSKNFRESTDKVFKGLDFDELDTQWITFVLRTEPDDPLRTLAREFGPKLPAESLVAPRNWADAYTLRVEQEHPTDADG